MIPKILYIAPILDRSGYASAARNYIRALDLAGCNLVTRHVTYDGGGYIQTAREKEMANIDASDIDIVISELTPNEFSRRPDVFSVLYFAWETDRIPPEWVREINKADLIMVPCDENVRACITAGVEPPVVKIPHTFDKGAYNKAIPFDMPGFENHFKFLAICQASKKKGLDSLLFSYLNEFTIMDEVLLILKVYFGPNDGDNERKAMLEQVQDIKNMLRLKAEHYPKVLVLQGLSSDEAIAKLYATSDCYSLVSRGEGWGIPHFDALGYGLPALGVKWGGTAEFINEKNGFPVDYALSPCHSMPHPHPFMYTALDNWAEPDILDTRKKMRSALAEWKVSRTMDNGGPWETRKQTARDTVGEYSFEKIGSLMRDTIVKYYEMWKNNRGN